MTNKLIPALALGLVLAACNQEDHNIVAGEHKSEVPAPPKLDPSLLPPSILASKAYRCKDNSLVYIDWMSDQSARSKTDRAATSVPVAPGDITGTKDDTAIRYKGQACHG